ncbi:DUF1835 domain-containing protein [Compostibacter hankyongensis]|uniref:DUF1835 domain-containing protein n=1 Tax=Compostibacter hankyongensis TaxID=1007089 RepID=A0ABP8FVL6_9BACT
MEKLLHIVFDRQGAEALQQSFQLDDIIAGDIFILEDNLSCGPLEEEPGGQVREAWWQELTGLPEGFPGRTDAEKRRTVLERMQEDESNEVWIWAAQNARDVCAYYSLIAPLADFQGRVHIIYLNNLPFINEKGALFYPVTLGQVLPREFLKARKLAREITPSEFELDGEEWSRLVSEHLPVRILEGGKKLKGCPEDFFDKILLGHCHPTFQKAWRVIQQTLTKSGHTPEEHYLNGRLKTLVAAGMLEAEGEAKGAKDYSVKTRQGAARTDNSETYEGSNDNTVAGDQ